MSKNSFVGFIVFSSRPSALESPSTKRWPTVWINFRFQKMCPNYQTRILIRPSVFFLPLSKITKCLLLGGKMDFKTSSDAWEASSVDSTSNLVGMFGFQSLASCGEGFESVRWKSLCDFHLNRSRAWGWVKHDQFEYNWSNRNDRHLLHGFWISSSLNPRRKNTLILRIKCRCTNCTISIDKPSW